MLDLVTTDSPSKDFISFLVGELLESNRAAGLSVEPERPVAVSASEDGECVGGLNGRTHWNWLIISSLYVKPEHRGKSVAASLLKAAEREACARGCVGIRLLTNELEAPDFYEHSGFERAATFEDHPKGTKTFLYTKRLGSRDP